MGRRQPQHQSAPRGTTSGLCCTFKNRARSLAGESFGHSWPLAVFGATTTTSKSSKPQKIRKKSHPSSCRKDQKKSCNSDQNKLKSKCRLSMKELHRCRIDAEEVGVNFDGRRVFSWTRFNGLHIFRVLCRLPAYSLEENSS